MTGQPKVRSIIPRGFSRYYVLYLLQQQPMTGKEIMREAEARSGGAWRPSPGLVYPLLGRLLSESLIDEAADGKYVITERGVKAFEEYAVVQAQLSRQFEVVAKLGLAGKFLVEDMLDRIMGLGASLRDSFDRLTTRQQARYKAFLKKELQRVEERERASK